MNRAQLSPVVAQIQKQLPDLLGILEADPQWYASVYFERKASQTYSANLKQTQLADQAAQGAVLRIYDGYTLFEQATDQVDFASLRREAHALVTRVRNSKPTAHAVKRDYPTPKWADRLATPLDPEIQSQIPKNVDARTPVHFGIRYEKNPFSPSTEERLAGLQALLDRMKALAPQADLQSTDLTYLMARETIAEEEAIFIDRESHLSQTIYRVSRVLMMMSGADRTAHRLGGLGGLEAITVSDETVLNLLNDLKALKKAERLKPGKYKLLIGPSLAGVLAHEAFGHSQEADTCARGRSKAWDLHQSGEKVGNQHATILNNPAVFQNGTEPAAAWGSYFFDEEGWLAHEQILLDRGVLNPPMTNLTSAIRLGIPRSANGKRESWQSGVYTRQTNTYFSPGDQTLDAMMAMIDDGFFATNAAGGMEDPKGMGIQVGIQYLKEVKNGQFTGRVFKGPAGGDIQLTGYVPDVLNSILAKSKIEFNQAGPDTAKHPVNDCGGCGKYHKELVFAGCGGTYMLLDQMTLG